MSARGDAMAKDATLEDRVAAEVRSELARRKMQQYELAALLNEHHSWVSKRFFARTRRIAVDDLERTARALGLAAADLLPSDARESIRVTGRYREQTERTDAVRPNVLAHTGDASPVRADQHRRPRRPVRAVPRMPIMQSAAA